jgi:tetratricopeptide (TPR) repeat protein
MRKPDMYSKAFFVATAVFLLCHRAPAQDTSGTSSRWDLQMIAEAPIWKNLLVDYSYADRKERWPERKRALQRILDKYPQSTWADDAALVLAGGKASFEGNAKEAIADLQQVVRKYPRGQTIVVRWDPLNGCLFDDVWLTWQGGLVFLNQDDSVRAATPFSENGITQREKEALAYFEHLEQFPRGTAVTAKLIWASVLMTENMDTQALSVLNDIVSTSRTYLALVSRADEKAALRPDGFLISMLSSRPEYQAYLLLARSYEKQGAAEKALEVASQLVELVSEDGWRWEINRQVADLYKRNGQNDRAKAQYQLALAGLRKQEDVVQKRNKLVEGREVPDRFWNETREEIQRAVP